MGTARIIPDIPFILNPKYKKINDKTVKHNDKLNARLLEFLLYQTGLLIRMVLRVSEQIEGN